MRATLCAAGILSCLCTVANLLMTVPEPVYKLKWHVCHIFRIFHWIKTLSACVPSPVPPYACVPRGNLRANAATTSVSALTFNKVKPANETCHYSAVKCLDLQHGSQNALCKLTSSPWQVAVTCISICLPVQCLFVLSWLFWFVLLCGHPSVYLPLYRHVCVSVRVCVCMHIRLSRNSSLWQPNPACVYLSPSARCISRGNIKKTNRRLSSCETDCFWAAQFLTMILMNGFMENVASWRNLMLALWSPNEFHLSEHADGLHHADQCKHVKCRHAYT